MNKIHKGCDSHLTLGGGRRCRGGPGCAVGFAAASDADDGLRQLPALTLVATVDTLRALELL